MKILVVGSDHNSLVGALAFRRQGHEVEVIEGAKFGGVASVLPGLPLAPEVATAYDLGASLEIVGRVGVSSLGEEVRLSLREVDGAVSGRDKERWASFKQVMNNASEVWRGLFQEDYSDVVTRWREFGRRQSMEVLRLPCQSLSELLDDWFESELLKATLAATALRGSRQGPFAPGSAFLLLQRWARGEVFGRARTGGMVLKKLAEERGVVFQAQTLERFEVSGGRVSAAVLDSGAELSADVFVTNEDPVCTLTKRVGVDKVGPEEVEIASHWDCRSTTTVAKLNPLEKWDGALVSFADSLEALERAYDPTKYGGYSEVPFAELDSRAGWLYLQHLGGEAAADKVKEFCEKYSLGEVKRLYTPTDLEEQYAVTGGHLFGGERSLWQSYTLRERLRRPLSNLYLCGASTGPGDYSGVSGLMCATKVAHLTVV